MSLAGEEMPERIRRLVEPHLFYVVQLASTLRSRRVPFEDLLAAGNVGLVEAAHRFDPSKDVKFLTYASWWIRKRMLDLVTREGKSVRLSRYARERRRDVDRVRNRLRQTLGREPNRDEIARAAGIRSDDVASAESDRLVVLSLERDNETLRSEVSESCLIDHGAPSPEERASRQELLEGLEEELERLPARQRQLLERRFGLGGTDSMTFQELGDRLGLSRERARQIEQDTLDRLRRRLAARFGSAPAAGRGRRRRTRAAGGAAER